MFSNKYMPHGHCYFWEPEVLWPIVAGDITTGTSYMVLTAILYNVTRNHSKHSILVRILRIYALFIFFCGLGHFIDVANIWLAQYKLKAFWGLGTGLVSLAAIHNTYLALKVTGLNQSSPISKSGT